jgi:hypothetical protein
MKLPALLGRSVAGDVEDMVADNRRISQEN